MIAKHWMVTGIIGAIVIAELTVLALIKVGKLDLFGVNKKHQEFITKNYLGVDGLPSIDSTTDLGVNWTRVYLSWGEVEKNGWDSFLETIDQLGATQKVVTVLADNPKEVICPQGAGSCPVAEIARYEDFIKQATQKCAGKVRFWQIEDEVFSPKSTWQGSVEQYQKILEVAYKTLKTASRENQIILGGIDLKNLSVADPTVDMQTIEGNLTKVFSGSALFDVADIRLFHTIDSIPARIKWLGKKMSNFNFQKPIWSLGVAGPDLSAGAYNDQAQAEEIVKRMLIGFEAGAEKLFYYRYQSLDTGQTDPLSATLGLIDSQGKQKPAFVAFQFMAEKISGFASLKNINLTDGATGYQLSFSDRSPLFVLWAERQMVVKLPPEVSQSAQVHNYLGESIVIADRSVYVSPQPIYVEIE